MNQTENLDAAVQAPTPGNETPTGGQKGGRGHAGSSEVIAQPPRRTFTAEYKLKVLAEADACTTPGAIGALLRREGLYASHLAKWRAARKRGAMAQLERKRGRKSQTTPLAAENEQLKQDVARLTRRLERAELIIDIQKKVSVLLGIPLKSLENGGNV